MGSVNAFLSNMNWYGLLGMLISAAAALLCITFHELAHGYAAYRLGDPTAKMAGRLTLNPLKHLDPLGLAMMMIVKVGWAKPVPVDIRRFQHPKRDMSLTALAGPAANFVMAAVGAAICSVLYHFAPFHGISLLIFCFFANVVLLSAGLGIFNLLPISPLDGSKVLFSLLPDRIYYKILRYEKYVMVILIVLVLVGVFDRPLSFLIEHVLSAACKLTGLPLEYLMFGLEVPELLPLL